MKGKPALAPKVRHCKSAVCKIDPTRIRIRTGQIQLFAGRALIGECKLMEIASKPLLRWAGSKAWLAAAAKALVPPSFAGKYYEPFCGAASVYFALHPHSAALSDKNEELITAYKVIRDDPEGVIALLRGYPHGEGYFYKMRAITPRSSRHLAARFIYLNRTCWNGLYRVNSEGIFNTPFGRRDNPDIADAPRLRKIAEMLRSVDLSDGDFEECVTSARAGDWVYLDPPYISGHQNNGFLMYNARLFSWNDQERLANLALCLKNKGVHVLVSNSDHQPVVQLYKQFYYYRVSRRSLIAGQVENRGVAAEAILSSYPLLGHQAEVIP